MTAIGLRIKASRSLRNLRRIRIDISTRMAWVLLGISTLLLAGLMTYWLMLATRTALLSKELEDLEKHNNQLIEQINDQWSVIGEATTDTKMQERARAAGYRPAERVEYLVKERKVSKDDKER